MTAAHCICPNLNETDWNLQQDSDIANACMIGIDALGKMYSIDPHQNAFRIYFGQYQEKGSFSMLSL